MMLEPCSDCNGDGFYVTGPRIGPCEIRETGRFPCSKCKGEGLLPLWCLYCGHGTPAQVLDVANKPKCLLCYEADRRGA